mmetsp:Transcript_54826/g.119620  ORF Transcript_54826/g.119620 Transcript_54826/m.119620 type:complete len:226 (-) Transcript_54826:227-904(-)
MLALGLDTAASVVSFAPSSSFSSLADLRLISSQLTVSGVPGFSSRSPLDFLLFKAGTATCTPASTPAGLSLGENLARRSRRTDERIARSPLRRTRSTLDARASVICSSRSLRPALLRASDKVFTSPLFSFCSLNAANAYISFVVVAAYVLHSALITEAWSSSAALLRTSGEPLVNVPGAAAVVTISRDAFRLRPLGVPSIRPAKPTLLISRETLLLLLPPFGGDR